MSRQCEIVQDLLPLYVDEICSPASREMVRSHLSSCKDCTAVLRQLKNSEIEDGLADEKTEVIEKHNQFFRRKSAVAGMIIGAALMIPVIICLIASLASGNSIGNLLIVLAALLLAASLIVVPLIMPRNRFLWTLGLFTAALLLLLAVSAAAGDAGWFFTASSGVLLGMTIVFGPVVVNHEAVRNHLGNHKALIVMACATLWFILLMVSIGLTSKGGSWWTGVMLPVMIPVVTAWLIFLIFRYFPGNRLVRTGVFLVLTGVLGFVLNNLVAALYGYPLAWPAFRPSVWNMFTIDGNIRWLCLICGGAAGLILILTGCIKGGKKK